MFNLKAKYKSLKASIRINGWKAEFRRAGNYIKYRKPVPDAYKEWILLNEPDKKALEIEKKYESPLKTKFLIFVKNESEKILFRDQTYSNYDIVVSSPDGYEENIKKFKSDYCIFIGDEMSFQPFALFAIQDFIEHNECNVIYSDNDVLENEKRTNPDFKPHFAYDTLLSRNYIGNFIVVKTKFILRNIDVVSNISNIEPIYDIILRSSEKTKRIMHIDMVLYHKIKESVNTDEQKKIIANHLKRMGVKYDSIEDGEFKGIYKINYTLLANKKISIIIPNMDHIDDLKKCVESIEKSSYTNYDIVIVENNSKKDETFKFYDELKKKYDNIKIEKMDIYEFNYSAIVNYGVDHSDGEYLILLNNDIEIINQDWMEQMLMYVQRDDVGICGARLYYNDDSIQHAGVTIGIRGLAGHRYKDVNKKDFCNYIDICCVENQNAVTAACLMVKRSDYERVLGFDEKLAVAFNDVDFCLKIRKEKKAVIYNPYVQAYHYESKSRGLDTETKEKQERFAKEYAIFVKRWRVFLGKRDEYFNINFRLDAEIPSINYSKIGG